MNDIQGFAEIRKDAKTCKGAENPSEFIGQTCRVLEFGFDGCVLVLNPNNTALAMFDKEDVQRSFKCDYLNGVILPPGLDFFKKMEYVGRTINRKGGYNSLLMNMVIQASLMKGEFNDNFLWQKQ